MTEHENNIEQEKKADSVCESIRNMQTDAARIALNAAMTFVNEVTTQTHPAFRTERMYAIAIKLAEPLADHDEIKTARGQFALKPYLRWWAKEVEQEINANATR